MAKHYVNRRVGRSELRSALASLAQAEECAFFRLTRPYRRRLIAVALQFLGRGYSVNDFDLHCFYAQNPKKARLLRQELLIGLARVASHDAAQRGIGFQRGRIDPDSAQ